MIQSRKNAEVILYVSRFVDKLFFK